MGVAAFLPRHPGTIRILDVQGGLTEETLDHRFLPDIPPVRGILQGVEGWLDRRADAVITSHADVAKIMVGQFHVNLDKIHTVGDAAGDFPEPAAAEVEAHRHRLGLRPGEPVLLYAGLLGEHQGTPHLFEVAEALERRGAPGRVLALGYPEERWAAEARRRGLGDRLLFAGRFAYGDFAALLALGTVALSPKVSRTEGNQKVYAYLRAGLPVVAFDTPATRDILGGAGILVETGDGARLAAEAVTLLEDPAGREALAIRSRSRAAELGGWDAVAGRVLEAYRAAGLRFPTPD
jgi:glycosyltransferase involved in cell wall biosynthesis